MKWAIVKVENHYEIREVFLFALLEPLTGGINYYRKIEDAEAKITQMRKEIRKRKEKSPKPEVIKIIKYKQKESPN